MATINGSRIRTFTVPKFPNDFWEWLLVQKDVRTDIARQGYYILEKIEVAVAFKKWSDEQRRRYDERKIDPPEYRIPSLSVDFYSQNPRILDSNNLYTLPLGHGNCAIFDSNVLPPPYLKLNGWQNDAKELPVTIIGGFRNLLNSLSAHWNEQSFIKALHFCGAFARIAKEICDTDRYESGPSGHLASCFPFWMRDAKRNTLVRFVYGGITDLDECLYPRHTDVVVPIEAKIDSGHTGLAWHKLAFPAYRFIDNSKAMGTFRTGSSIRGISNSNVRIVPVYCLFNPVIKRAYIYIFPPIAAKRCLHYSCPEFGVVLNDPKQIVPKSVFEVKMSWL